MTADMFASLTASEADAMANRAFREAARCWQEARHATDPETRRILTECAESAEDFWRLCRDAARRKWLAVVGLVPDLSVPIGSPSRPAFIGGIEFVARQEDDPLPGGLTRNPGTSRDGDAWLRRECQCSVAERMAETPDDAARCAVCDGVIVTRDDP